MTDDAEMVIMYFPIYQLMLLSNGSAFLGRLLLAIGLIRPLTPLLQFILIHNTNSSIWSVP